MDDGGRDAVNPEGTETLYRQWIRDELAVMWNELYDAHSFTIGNHGHPRRDRQWSLRCDSLAERIKSATDLVGPASWHRDIGMEKLLSGWFQWANEKIGIENPDLPTEEDLDRMAQVCRDAGYTLRSTP